jgi:threonine dehydrogenase-like Zn-dependent dehydrogenase
LALGGTAASPPGVASRCIEALYYDGAGKLEWREEPDPLIAAPSDALVRPIAVSTCDLDQAIIHGSVPGSEQPFAIGHEGVGEVIEVGGAVTSVRPGDIVAIAYHVSCGRCDRCADALPLFCRETAADALAVFGLPIGADYGGLFSELIRVPFADHSLVRVPPNVSAVDAVSVGDNLTDAWRAVVPHLTRSPGADVLIMSEGSIGLFAADIARAYGAGRVRYVDPDPKRRALAKRFGADSAPPADFSSDEHEYAVSLVTHPDRAALHGALLATAPGGHCENLGFHFRDVELPLLAMHLKCLHFRSSLSNARSYMPAVLELLSSGRITPGLVATEVLAFETAADALPGAGFKPVFVRGPAQET